MSLWLCKVFPEGSLISGFWVSELALICKLGEELNFPLQELTPMFCLPRQDFLWGGGGVFPTSQVTSKLVIYLFRHLYTRIY